MTKASEKFGMNFNRPNAKIEEDSFSSKGFLNIQIFLGISLIILFTLMIVEVILLKMVKNKTLTYNTFYYELNHLIRVIHRFSFAFPAVICIAKSKNSTKCENYMSGADTIKFNQTLYLLELNKALAEISYDAINSIVQDVNILNYKKLINFFMDYTKFYTLNMEVNNGNSIFYKKENKMTFSESLLLIGNAINIIANKRTNAPIFLLSGVNSNFENLKLINDLDDYVSSVYNFLLNYDNFISNMDTAGLIIKTELTNITLFLETYFKYFHNIIFIIMIIQILIIIIYLIVFDKIISEIINYIILNFDTTYDSEYDFQRLYNIKISQIETLLQIYTSNPIITINAMNKNCSKFKTLENARKKEEHRTNMNKNKISNEKQYKILFNKEKYVKWHEILTNGQNTFYILFTIIIFIVYIIVYMAIYICFNNYFSTRNLILSLTEEAWNNEKMVYTIANYYKTMMLYNMTINEMTKNYYSNSEQKTIIDQIENSLYSILSFSKTQKTIPSLYKDFCYFLDDECDCNSLYNYYMNDSNSAFYKATKAMEKNYGIYGLKNIFIQSCIEYELIIDHDALPAFQSLYQKIINSIVSLNDFSYEGLIDKLFSRDFKITTAIFLYNVQYITNIYGKLSYTNARMNLFAFLDENIYLSLILYCVSEVTMFLIFLLIYVRNMNNKCRNMWKLKKIFQITDSNKL